MGENTNESANLTRMQTMFGAYIGTVLYRKLYFYRVLIYNHTYAGIEEYLNLHT